MQKWEYKVLFKIDERELNELGDKGWELVGIACHANDCSADYDPAVLKRPKQ